MIKCFDGSELSERELASMCVPIDMLPLTPEERATWRRFENMERPLSHATLQEAAEFILTVVLPYRDAMREEASRIDSAEMAQCR